jgi:hypothetical protein
MNRWKASGLHLFLSFLVVGGIALSGLLLWYPYQLYRIAGFDRLLLIMFCVDLIAGPLLTLVVYKAGKRSLRFDLATIALFQLAFLGYGLHTLWQIRPVFLVGSEDRFNLVFANEIEVEALSAASKPEWRRLSWSGPRLVGVRPPSDPKERMEQLFATLSSGEDIDKLPRLYVDFYEIASPLVHGAAGHNERKSNYPAGGKPSLRRVPITSRFDTAWMLIDARTGQPVEVVQD